MSNVLDSTVTLSYDERLQILLAIDNRVERLTEIINGLKNPESGEHLQKSLRHLESAKKKVEDAFFDYQKV